MAPAPRVRTYPALVATVLLGASAAVGVTMATASTTGQAGQTVNWLRGERIGHGSFDRVAGSLDGRGGLLDFRAGPHFRPVILDPTTGEVVH